MIAARARFRVVRNTARVLTIKDLGPWDEHPTVTNDVEAVVAELHDRGILLGRRLLYIDSEGRLDEIEHREGRFVRFKPIGSSDRRRGSFSYVAEEGSEVAKLREEARELERERIRAALRIHGACIRSAAAELGLSRGGLHYRMRVLGLLSPAKESA